MSNNALLALAIIKVNWDSERKDHLDVFIPIVASCLKKAHPKAVSLPDIQQQLKDLFSLDLPLLVIKTILKKVLKKGYIKRISFDDIYQLIPAALDNLNFDEVQTEILKRIESLITDFQNFSSKKYNKQIPDEDAETILLSFLEDNKMEVLLYPKEPYKLFISSYLTRRNLARHKQVYSFLIGSYITHLHETGSTQLNDIEDIAKGLILSKVVNFPDPGRVKEKFKRAAFYFDTSFLIFALGYCSKAYEAPKKELLQLVYGTGAKLYCFEHNLGEIESIMKSCANNLTNPLRSEGYGASTETMEFLIQNNYTPADVEGFISSLETNLKRLRISVVETPDYVQEYGIDEKSLEDTLQSDLGYKSKNQLINDIKSLTAIHRLRKGKIIRRVEICKALFITTNSRLVYSSRNFFREMNDSLPPCISDSDLTTLLWLKDPDKANNLPKKRIIADAYAAIQPSESLFQSYLSKINDLQKSGKVSIEEYSMLRYHLAAKTVLMEKTLGEEEGVLDGTVKEILGFLEKKLTEETRTQASKSLKKLKERDDQLKLLISNISRNFSKFVKYLVLFLLFISLSLTFPGMEERIQPSFPILFFSSNIIIILAAFYSMWKGVFINSLAQQLEIRTSSFIESTFKKLRIL